MAVGTWVFGMGRFGTIVKTERSGHLDFLLVLPFELLCNLIQLM